MITQTGKQWPPSCECLCFSFIFGTMMRAYASVFRIVWFCLRNYSNTGVDVLSQCYGRYPKIRNHFNSISFVHIVWLWTHGHALSRCVFENWWNESNRVVSMKCYLRIWTSLTTYYQFQVNWIDPTISSSFEFCFIFFFFGFIFIYIKTNLDKT